jgi:hypothetical protein
MKIYRPKSMGDALSNLKNHKDIEISNGNAFKFAAQIEGFSYSFKFDKNNKGWATFTRI